MNKLHYLKEFEKILANYHVSDQSQKILDKTKLVLLVAPSASGRNTIINKLVETGEYFFVISDTTRQPRINDGVLEKDGREYWFRKEQELLDDLKQGKFLEAEILHRQQVSGISIRELKKALDTGRIPITDVDIGGVRTIKKAKSDTIAIMVLPPSFEEWQHRMTTRGALDKDELTRRTKTAVRIFSHAQEDESMIFVVNDNLDQAVQTINRIVTEGHIVTDQQDAARKLVSELLDKTVQALRQV